MTKSTRAAATGLVLLAASSLAACSETSEADGAYAPASNVQVLVGYAAGGGTDAAARGMAQQLDAQIDSSSFVVQNLDGGAGLRSMQTLVREASNDTLMQQIDILTPLYNDGVDISFDDITPVAQTATTPAILATSPESGITDAADLLAQMKDADDITIGLASSLRTREAAAWAKMADLASVPVDNRNLVPNNGMAEVLPELISGRADAALVVPSAAQNYFDSGELVPLAALTDERLEAFPDLPTLKEEGTDVVYTKPFGVIMSSEASDEAVAYWAEQLKAMTESPEYKEFAETAGFQVEYKDSNEYDAFLESQGQFFEDYLSTVD